jgi:hypothetical protein
MEWLRAVEVVFRGCAALPYLYGVHLMRVSLKVLFNTIECVYTGHNTGFVILSNGGSEDW